MTRCSISCKILLQWGHASTGVERPSNTRTHRSYKMLQWGHASTGVERSKWLDGILVAQWLQWGHASTGVERHLTMSKDSVGKGASMGPRLNRRGKILYAAYRVPINCRFNGATPQQAWKEINFLHFRITFTSFNGATPQQAWKVS